VLTYLPETRTSKTGFGQVKNIKEFVLINIIFFSKFGFQASRWQKKKTKTEIEKFSKFGFRAFGKYVKKIQAKTV
jgi:hypothetical protein